MDMQMNVPIVPFYCTTIAQMCTIVPPLYQCTIIPLDLCHCCTTYTTVVAYMSPVLLWIMHKIEAEYNGVRTICIKYMMYACHDMHQI